MIKTNTVVDDAHIFIIKYTIHFHASDNTVCIVYIWCACKYGCIACVCFTKRSLKKIEKPTGTTIINITAHYVNVRRYFYVCAFANFSTQTRTAHIAHFNLKVIRKSCVVLLLSPLQPPPPPL